MQKQPINPLEFPSGKPELVIDLNDGTNEQVSIIVVHHNQPEYLNICIQSIHCMSNFNNYETIVVDNASGRETQEYLDMLQEEGIKVVRNPKNEYWSKAANQGVSVADTHSKFLVFLHADTVILDPAWLDVLTNISVSRDSGIVGTQLQTYYIQKQKVDFVQEWCMLISRQCWNEVGPWNEDLPFIGMSFIMTLKAQLQGFQPQATGNNIVHHYKAFASDPNEYERMGESAMSTIGKIYMGLQQRH